MNYSFYLDAASIKRLELEVVSREAKIYLTRKIERNADYSENWLMNTSWLVNRSRELVGETVHVLESDGWGEYETAVYEWYQGELALALRRLDTPRFVEIVCEVIDKGWLSLDQVNEVLESEGVSFNIYDQMGQTKVTVFTLEDLEAAGSVGGEHPNIRTLVDRMDRDLAAGDYSGVLHSSATIFETLAKDMVGAPGVQDATLGGFFDRYVKDSYLPQLLLDKVLQVYKDRNTTPLAGHGSTKIPAITEQDAVTLCELTKAFVRIEYQLQLRAAAGP